MRTKHHESLRRRNNTHYSFIIVHNSACVWTTRDGCVCCVMHSSEVFFSSFCSAERNTLCHGKVTCKAPVLLTTICCHAEGAKVHKIIWLDIIVPAICSSCTYREVSQRRPSVTTFLLGLCTTRLAAKLVYFRGSFSCEASHPFQVSAIGLSHDNQPA